jgi:y4mF family transcriptional regulator
MSVSMIRVLRLMNALSEFVRQRRKSLGLTQPELAEKAGTGLRFVRDLEQGKKTLRMDKVNQVLGLFGYELGPVRQEREEKADTLQGF